MRSLRALVALASLTLATPTAAAGSCYADPLRLANAMVEMEEKDFYDYQIVNDTLESAVAKVGAVMFVRP